MLFLCSLTAKLVGIHCTHGLNRTGYFVVSYMVLVMSKSPSEAIKEFALARGYEIERENYLSGIMMHGTDEKLKEICNRADDVVVPNLVARKRWADSNGDKEEKYEATAQHKRFRRIPDESAYETTTVDRNNSHRNNYNQTTDRRYQNSRDFSRNTHAYNRPEANSWRPNNPPNISRYTSYRPPNASNPHPYSWRAEERPSTSSTRPNSSKRLSERNNHHHVNRSDETKKRQE